MKAPRQYGTEVVWRPLVGWEKVYEVSCSGQFRRIGGDVLEGNEAGKWGYRTVTLTKGKKRRKVFVHVAVAMTFIGNAPAGRPLVDHGDGNKGNNHVDNLEWVSHGENQRRAYRLGLKKAKPLKGERNPNAKLSAAKVREMRATAGVSQRQWAKRFGVSRAAVRLALKGATWNHEDVHATGTEGSGCPRDGGRDCDSPTPHHCQPF